MAKYIELRELKWTSAYAYQPGDYHMINTDHIISVAPYKDRNAPDLNGVTIYFVSDRSANFIEDWEMVRARMIDD